MYGQANGLSTQTTQWTGAADAAMAKSALPVRLVDEATQSLDAALKELHDQIGAVRGFNDAMQGSQPEAAMAGGPENANGSRADMLRQRLNWLHGAITELRREVNRLSSI